LEKKYLIVETSTFKNRKKKKLTLQQNYSRLISGEVKDIEEVACRAADGYLFYELFVEGD